MTHTLHRRGSRESLSKDYTVLTIPAQGHNDPGSDPKMAEFLRIALRHNPKNIGSLKMNMYTHSAEDVVRHASKLGHAVFDNPTTVTAFLKDLQEADLGMSVVVGGVLDTVNEAVHAAGLARHTVEVSLGVWGNTDRLPAEDILEITTMCGHGMVSANLVKAMVEDVKADRRTPTEAANRLLAPHCTCGVFNPARAADLLAAMASKE